MSGPEELMRAAVSSRVCRQGAMSGPEEFAEGVARGAQSLFGHVIGGAATSVSLLTESVGNMLSVLSFDEDYKRVSRERDRNGRQWSQRNRELPGMGVRSVQLNGLVL